MKLSYKEKLRNTYVFYIFLVHFNAVSENRLFFLLSMNKLLIKDDTAITAQRKTMRIHNLSFLRFNVDWLNSLVEFIVLIFLRFY